jgi:DNA polymerase I
VVVSPICNKFQEVEELLSREGLVAFTAPLIMDERVFVGFCGSPGDSGCIEVSLAEFSLLGKLLFQPTRTKIAVHGLKRIWEYLDLGTSELDLDLVNDTKLMAYLLNPDSGRGEAEGLSLTHLAHEYLNEEYPHMAVEVRDKGVPTAIHEALASDARTIFRLSEVLPAEMDRDLYNLYRRVEVPLMHVLHGMRQVGIGIDGERARHELHSLQQELASLTATITEGLAVDLSSHADLLRFLVQRGVRFENPYMYTAPKLSTPVLEELALDHPVVQDILDWRQLDRDVAFLSTAAGNQRVHPVWGQTRSGTSRIYAGRPAVQNVSRRLRHLFVPVPGHALIKADYSQAQLRILAHLSGDEELIRIFNEGGDVHAETARLLGIDRDLAKQVNFGICFGISAPRLAARINSEILKRNCTLTPEEQQPLIAAERAQGYIDQFHERYPGVQAFFEREWKKLKRLPQKDRVVRSPLGRIRRFDTYPSKALERSFRVTWPQQIEADLIKTAMLRLDRIFRKRNMEARIVMMIHDALWIECPEGEADKVRHFVMRMMSTAGKLKVPLDVDIK